MSRAVCFSSGIHLQFLNFSTEAIHDYLEIRSGTLETGTVIDRFSGPVIPKPLFSTTHQTSFFFHSDYSQNKPGFHITYQGEFPPCLHCALDELGHGSKRLTVTE